jgi:hypothetical protein
VIYQEVVPRGAARLIGGRGYHGTVEVVVVQPGREMLVALLRVEVMANVQFPTGERDRKSLTDVPSVAADSPLLRAECG